MCDTAAMIYVFLDIGLKFWITPFTKPNRFVSINAKC